MSPGGLLPAQRGYAECDSEHQVRDVAGPADAALQAPRQRLQPRNALIATAGSVIAKSSDAGQARNSPAPINPYSTTPRSAFGTPSSAERGLRKSTAQPP